MNEEQFSIEKRLKEKFAVEDLGWRIMRSGTKKNGDLWALCLCYVDNRAIQDRLDRVCGFNMWKNEFQVLPGMGVLCGLSIKIKDEWITKWDGGDFRPDHSKDGHKLILRGGISDSSKRAASAWGIGRYLYGNKEAFAQINKNGKFNGKLKDKGNDIYFKWNPPILSKEFLPEVKQ
jgi:hypothetical protein